jgi:hypothetical protein
MNKKYIVRLADEERTELAAVIPSSPRNDRPFSRRPDLVRGAVGAQTFGRANAASAEARHGPRIQIATQ